VIGALPLVIILSAGGFTRVPSHPWLYMSASRPATPLPDSELRPNSDRLEALVAEGHPYVDLFSRIDLEINSDGTVSERKLIGRHFLTTEGIQEAGTTTFSARSEVEKLFIEEAYIRLPDGSIRHLDLANIQVSTTTTPNVFSDVHHVALPFEGLVPGSTTVIRSTRVQRTTEWPLPWSEVYPTRGFAPILDFELNIAWDADVPTPSWVSDAADLTCREAGHRRLRCTARDVPPLDLEPGMASWIEAVPHLVVSRPQSWGDIARTELQLIQESLSMGPVVAGVGKLLDGATDQMEKLRRIHRFVADDVRYVALLHGKSAIAPAPPARTLERLYGDCKGKVALFLALARQAGLEAYPVLVATDRITPSKLQAPSWKYFDHMIGCADLREPSRTICMDFTSPYTQTGDLPAALYGAVSYVLRDMNDIPHAIDRPQFVWDIDLESENEIRCNGTIVERLTRRFTGPSAAEMRSGLRGRSKDERQKWALESYRSVIGSRYEPTFELRGIDDVQEPIAIASTTEFEGEALVDMDEYLEPDAWLNHYAGWFETSNQTHPFVLQGVRIRSKSSYAICEDRTMRFVGARLDLYGAFGKLTRSYRRGAHDVTVETLLELPSREIQSQDLDRYRRFLSTSLAQTNIWFRTRKDGKPLP